MEFNSNEYNSLRAELIHHDRTCLTIISLLLTASTAVYGLVVNKQLSYLLIVLSVIWHVGFLYLIEKRANIKRISFYIQTQIEPEISNFGWEEWSRNFRYLPESSTDEQPESSTNKQTEPPDLPALSPLKEVEFPLLKMTYIVNCIWLCFLTLKQLSKIIIQFNIISAIIAIVTLIIVIVTPFIKSFVHLNRIVKKYYDFNQVYDSIR